MNKNPYFEYLRSVLDIPEETLSQFASRVSTTISSGKNVWLIGNGGSASTAEHFETDLSFVRLGSKVTKSRVCALTANSSLVTAIANDIGYENIFSHQLMRRAEREDLCIIISASGNSENLIKAVEVCKEIGVTVIALLGFDGGKLLHLIENVLLVKTELGKYGPVEDAHLAICHALSARISTILISNLELQK